MSEKLVDTYGFGGNIKDDYTCIDLKELYSNLDLISIDL